MRRDSFWQRLHHDQRGAVTLETVLIIAAIALPVLIFVLKFAWPKISDYFTEGMDNLQNESNEVINGSGSGEHAVTWLTAALWTFLAAATVTDVWRQTIPNSITYTGMFAALALRGLILGIPGLEDGFKGWAACGAIMIVCYVLLGIGGGDVKLIAMSGAFLGLYPGFEALLWTLVLGGIFGVSVLIWQIGAGNLIRGCCHHLSLMWRAKGWVPLQKSERTVLQQPLFLAPAALVAALIVTWPG